MRSSLQTSNIIAICGLKCSGKDTAANMLYYLLNTPKWLHSYKWFRFFQGKTLRKKWSLTAFAKPLKETLSIILNKPIEWFEDRDNKENCYVHLPSLQIYKKEVLGQEIILSENKFLKIIKSNEPIPEEYFISIRQLMQYYGTNVIRKFLGDKTWINAALSGKDKIIVSDLRFRTEYTEIKNRNGLTIYIKRDSAVPGNHSSEREVIDLYNEGKFDYIVENNGSLEDLFNNLKQII